MQAHNHLVLLLLLVLQTELGCAANMWRWTQEGYLREILTARVYDVAVSSSSSRTPQLTYAAQLPVALKQHGLQVEPQHAQQHGRPLHPEAEHS
jgi:hypothetical protein